jgi:hypothetical protein
MTTPPASIPIPNPVVPGQVLPAPDIPGAGVLADLSASLHAARAWLSDRHNWVRIAWTGMGVALIYGGVIVLARRPIESTAKVAASVAGKVPL